MLRMTATRHRQLRGIPCSLSCGLTLVALLFIVSTTMSGGAGGTRMAVGVAAAAASTTAPLSSAYYASYPGTAVSRLREVHRRIASLVPRRRRRVGEIGGEAAEAAAAEAAVDVDAKEVDDTVLLRHELSPALSEAWDDVRRRLLWCGGLRDVTARSRVGTGYTGHAFNDWNHVDLTCMRGNVADRDNSDGAVDGIARNNALGAGIAAASDPALGRGGSWSTCQLGAHREPPQDVAHVQFRAAVAFKLVWHSPPLFEEFVLLDDAGNLLARGRPTDGELGVASDASYYGGRLPPLQERRRNWEAAGGGRSGGVEPLRFMRAIAELSGQSFTSEERRRQHDHEHEHKSEL